MWNEQRFSLLLVWGIMLIFGISNPSVGSDKDYVYLIYLENRIKKIFPDSLDQADSLALILIEKANELGNDSLASLGWFFRGEVAYYRGHFDLSGDYYQKSINFLDSINAPEKKAVYYNNLGLVRYFEQRYNEALRAFLKSSDYERISGNDYGFAQCLHNIALVQEKAGRFKKAENYFRHSLSLFFQMDSLADAAAVLNDYAIFLRGQERFDMAIEKYNEAMAIYEKLDDSENIAKVKCNLGALFLHKKEYQTAAIYLEESLNYFKDMSSSAYLINLYSLFGDLYFEQGRTALAVIFYERAEDAAKNMGWDHLRQENLYSLFKALKAEKEYEKALEALEQYTRFKDSLIISNNAFLRETIDNELETLLMEKELDLMKAKNNQMKLVLIIIGLVLFLGWGGWFLYGRNQLLMKEKERRLLEQKLHQLQVEPHLIFNVLLSIQNYVIEDKKNEAIEYIHDIGELIRSILDYGEKELIYLEDEIDILNKYLKVQCRRFFPSNGYNEVRAYMTSGSGYLLVPPLLVRPLLDILFMQGKIRNSQRFGIEIRYEQQKKQLEMTLETRGIILDHKLSESGIELIKQRLELMPKGSKVASPQFIDVVSEGVKIGNKLKIVLPLIEESDDDYFLPKSAGISPHLSVSHFNKGC
ncbi:tetratricopeptide repeat protein [Thermophagus xiamenensis]|uniref:Tetratricopeptide repeat-containing protein n=1 Tax=Thermophagus xiamenensis TaxID=385682 RepID=A0A1I2FT29_9BACT|nr:tetratricopeptide repeat protein [Thermophagus xiamenensis]SFF07810.1 Tetratricopeptide repeat-containing protein [Thermophagus xiamenensis]